MRNPFSTPAFYVLLCVMVVCAGGMSWAIDRYGIRLRKEAIYAPGGRTLSTLPRETTNWIQVGDDDIASAEVVEELGTENYLTRDFVRKDDRSVRIQFHAAYYTGMIDTVPHVPDRCFVGGGMVISGGPWFVPMPLDQKDWRSDPGASEALGRPILQMRTLLEMRGRDGEIFYAQGGPPVHLPEGVEDLNLRVTEFTADTQKLYAGYFFIANGGTVANPEGVRLLAFDLNSRYAYYLKVQFSSWTVKSQEELAEQSASLLNELIPNLMQCVPDWVEVELGRYPPRTDDRQTTG